MKPLVVVFVWILAATPITAQEQIESEPFISPFSMDEMAGKQLVFETDNGQITIDLLPALAPNHVGLIIKLAGEGAFDGTIFHRMVQHGIVQGGDPITADSGRVSEYGSGGLGLVEAEITDASHEQGTVSSVLVPGDFSSGGSQFLICVVAQPGLDGQHSIWGQVVDGTDVVTKISETPVDADGRATERVVIRSAFVRDKPPPEVPPFSTEAVRDLSAYRVEFSTSLGLIAIDFYPDLAPNHVRNFLRLVDSGVYDGMAFHRVVPGFVIQSGHLPSRREPLTDRQQRFIQNLEPEFNATEHVRGIVSMARLDDPASATTSFFICTGRSAELDGVYTAFGVVVEGLEVVSSIEATPAVDEAPVNRVEIVSARVVRR